ncbi:WD40 repeat domain-containing protein [Streptomyces parvus]|uniref:WD40 repeat domain-containing protein n=1 Tax=Streptomyces parvus TaxID=66428 RepID=UPI0035E0B09A
MDGKASLQLTGHAGWVNAVAVFTSPDGTPRLATGGRDGTVRIWNPATGTQEGPPFTGHTRGVLAVAVFTAPDGTPASPQATTRRYGWTPARCKPLSRAGRT